MPFSTSGEVRNSPFPQNLLLFFGPTQLTNRSLILVDWYGEVEFWIGMGKVLLATGLIFYT